jgi:hypothetical protein
MKEGRKGEEGIQDWEGYKRSKVEELGKSWRKKKQGKRGGARVIYASVGGLVRRKVGPLPQVTVDTSGC